MSDFDILIRNGTVLDGGGGPALRADVLIKGDRIADIGALGMASARQTVDAAGKVVAPGFVDIHTHSDMQSLTTPLAESKVMAGVTTELLGSCGDSPFPLRGAARESRTTIYDKGLYRMDWEDVEGYIARAEESGYSINRALQVGHNTVRAAVMGFRRDEPSPEELKRMVDEIRLALEHGVFGFSTGLLYPPGCFCRTEEMIQLCRPVAEAGALYTTHIRSEGDRLEDAINEQLRIARETGVRTQISHLKVSRKRNWHKIDWLEETMHRAADVERLDVAADRYPYTAGSTGLDSVLPAWTYEGGTEREVKLLQDPESRARIAREVEHDYPTDESWQEAVVSYVRRAENKHLEGLNMLEISRKMGRKPMDAAFDLLIAEQAQVSAIFHWMSEDNLRRILSWPFVMIGSDSGVRSVAPATREGKPHPRGFGTSPRVLGRYCRELKLLTLPEAVRKLTGQTAERIGLPQRGLLRKGYFADITIFDPAVVIDRATFEDPYQYPLGIATVIVNGVVAVRDGQHTGAKAGRILRR